MDNINSIDIPAKFYLNNLTILRGKALDKYASSAQGHKLVRSMFAKCVLMFIIGTPEEALAAYLRLEAWLAGHGILGPDGSMLGPATSISSLNMEL